MSNPTIPQTFAERLELARAKAFTTNQSTRLRSDVAINDSLKRESIEILSGAILAVGEELLLDIERLENRIKLSRRSNYGRVCELINILASIYSWPIADNSQAKEIPELQDRMLDILTSRNIAVTGDLLLDIKDYKGYNSYLEQTTFTVIDGQEPMYDELEFAYLTFAEYANLPLVDFKMTETMYHKLETKALDKLKLEQELAQEALDKYKAMASMPADEVA